MTGALRADEHLIKGALLALANFFGLSTESSAAKGAGFLPKTIPEEDGLIIRIFLPI